jgi:hypothetical protein
MLLNHTSGLINNVFMFAKDDAAPALLHTALYGKGSCMIGFEIKSAGIIDLSLFNARGRPVRKLVNSYFTAGKHTVKTYISGCRPGVHFLRLDGEGECRVEKTVFVR